MRYALSLKGADHVRYFHCNPLIAQCGLYVYTHA